MSGSDTIPVDDWLQPRLRALVDEAVSQGFNREVVVAVIADIISSPPYDTAGPPEQQ